MGIYDSCCNQDPSVSYHYGPYYTVKTGAFMILVAIKIHLILVVMIVIA